MASVVRLQPDPRRPRIALVILSLGFGGAERVLSTLAKAWVAAGREIVLITLESVDDDFYDVGPGVRRVALGVAGSTSNPLRGILRNLQRVRDLRRALRAVGAQLVVSFMDTTNVLAILAARPLRLPVIVSERCDPSRRTLGAAWRLLRRVVYPRASGLVVQTERVAEWARAFMPAARIHVVPNPVRRPRTALDGARKRQGTGTIVAMGRLTHQKGFDILLRAFARCRLAGWTLRILGDGPERASLERLARELQLEKSVQFTGAIADPEPLLAASDLFVLPSRYEGFPNALLEAMACGLAVVAADCVSGPREIVHDGVDGLLVSPEDVDVLAAAMARLMSDPEERARLGRGARQVQERFAVERVLADWDAVVARSLPRKD